MHKWLMLVFAMFVFVGCSGDGFSPASVSPIDAGDAGKEGASGSAGAPVEPQPEAGIDSEKQDGWTPPDASTEASAVEVGPDAQEASEDTQAPGPDAKLDVGPEVGPDAPDGAEAEAGPVTKPCPYTVTTCIPTKCKTECEVCAGFKPCLDYINCRMACPSGMCGCETQHPEGVALGKPFADCIILKCSGG